MAQAQAKSVSASGPRHIAKEITPEDRRHRELAGVWPARPQSMASTVLLPLVAILEQFEHQRKTAAADRQRTPLGQAMLLAARLPAIDKLIEDVRFGIGHLRMKAVDAEAQLEAILADAGNGRPADLGEALRHFEIRQALGSMDAGARLAVLRDADPETVAAVRSAPAVVRAALVAPEVADQFEKHATERAVAAWIEGGSGRMDPREVRADAEHQIDQLEQAIAHVENRIRPYRAPAGAEG